MGDYGLEGARIFYLPFGQQFGVQLFGRNEVGRAVHETSIGLMLSNVGSHMAGPQEYWSASGKGLSRIGSGPDGPNTATCSFYNALILMLYHPHAVAMLLYTTAIPSLCYFTNHPIHRYRVNIEYYKEGKGAIQGRCQGGKGTI